MTACRDLKVIHHSDTVSLLLSVMLYCSYVEMQMQVHINFVMCVLYYNKVIKQL